MIQMIQTMIINVGQWLTYGGLGISQSPTVIPSRRSLLAMWSIAAVQTNTVDSGYNSRGGLITGHMDATSGLKMRTHKYSEVTAKYRPINIPTYIPKDSPPSKLQGLSQILLSAAMFLLTMSTLVKIQKERAVYGCFFKWWLIFLK